jgi:hypothetical protein
MPADMLLAELKAPCTIEGLDDILRRVETRVRSAPSSFWEAEGMKCFEETYFAVLLARLKFFLLATAAQQLVILDLRDLVAAEAGSPK